MTEHCPDHHALAQEVGKISGNVELILSMQQEIKNNVSELFSKYNENHTDAAVAKTKAAPIYWVIGGIGFVILNVITAMIAAKVIK